MNPEITVIVPYIRPKGMKRCEAAMKTAGLPFVLLKAEDKERIGVPKMVNALVEASRTDIVVFIGDDTIPAPLFLFYARNAMRTFKDGWGLVGLNDLTGRDLPVHWMGHKKLLPHIGGVFFHEGYTHCNCDRELYMRAAGFGRFIYSQEAVVQHNHPICKNETTNDPDYIRVYSEEVRGKDRELFVKRRANEWKN